ncbi:MAG: acyl-CoA dehydrogenase family protein [Candidatus Eisenbacteria bacterium]|nr:acyl-CoA dehydrogenase family protein [Candidatus Eisenbacteria bacterium]
MDFSISEEQKALRDSIVQFARKELNQNLIERDREQQFPRDLWTKCGEMRLPGLAVPEEYGGLGLESLDTAMALEALGYACEDSGLVFSICAHLLPCVVPIVKYGTEEQKRRWLPGLSNGELIAANCMTEPNTGSDAFAMITKAVPDGDGYRITGTKTFSSNGPVADLLVLFALTDAEKRYHGGVTTFLIPRHSEGITVSKKIEKLGLRTSPFGEISLDNVYVGPEAILGGVGGGSTLFAHSMDWERTCLFAFNVGVMERLLEKSVEYARTRQQFGKPISQFPAISAKIADMKVRLEAARLLVYRAAWKLTRSRTVSMDASIAKLFTSEALLTSSLDAVQIHGGYGYSTEYQIERALRDSVGGTIYSGTSEMQRNIIASWLGL